MWDVVRDLFSDPLLQASGVVMLSVAAAFLAEYTINKTLVVAASKTRTPVDDAIVEIIRRPVFLSVLVYGLDLAVELVQLPVRVSNPIAAVLKTLIIFVWALAGMRVGSILLQSFSERARPRSMLQPTTLPVFDILLKTLVIAAGIYFIFLAWKIDLTAWLASAGIIGIAVGFAAKDTLANLFSGIFIIADQAYKVKDWIVLDGELRGEVTHIGLRSTRILTPDDVEITVPNAVIGNAQLLNETGGPYTRQRVRIHLSVAYGSDVDQVREVLTQCTLDAPHILTQPKPHARFRELGDSGLVFELWVWIDEPKARELVIDEMTTRVYKSLNAANIEIPYAKQDVYIRQMPARAGPTHMPAMAGPSQMPATAGPGQTPATAGPGQAPPPRSAGLDDNHDALAPHSTGDQ